MKQGLFFTLIIFAVSLNMQAQTKFEKPLRLAVAGLSHGHISFILDRPQKDDFEVVGVSDPNPELTDIIARRYDLSPEIVYNDLEKMLDDTRPEAIVAFGPIFDHLVVVEACAPRGIHVMVEKPLAVSRDHAARMAELAEVHRIHLLTNYETSWYPTTAMTLNKVQNENFVGKLRKAVFHHGHQGPVEIGCDKYFLAWLTDPKLNGGGALTDFGCYGANLMTALMRGEKPVSVTAVTRTFKPLVYPRVDDEASIIVSYPDAQCIIQASWNWPFNRKDMEVYGTTGYIEAKTKHDLRLGNHKQAARHLLVTAADVEVYEDPFSYFADVINGKITVEPFGLYSLKNNVRVVEILDAARESAKTGKTVYF